MSKKTNPIVTTLLGLLLFCSTVTVLGAGKQGGSSQGEDIQSPSHKTLDANEQAHLEFMREEEKLARDVYITLGIQYPQLKVFGKIDDSEQRHICAVCDKLKKYGVDDPNTNDNVGVYTGRDYGHYFSEKYTRLVERGSESSMEALYVGAYIEELDMLDIEYCPQEIVEQDNGIDSSDDCGKNYTDNANIKRLYKSLIKGSKSHLRAFVRNIERSQGEGSYQAQVLPQDQLNEILGR